MAGADVNICDSLKCAPVHYAATLGRMEMLRYLVEVGNSDVNMFDCVGRTPVYMAVEKGYIEVVKFLVEVGGANVNLASNDGNSPLHHAGSNCKTPELINVLIKAGADLNSRNDKDLTPLIITDHPAIVHALAEAGAPRAGCALWS